MVERRAGRSSEPAGRGSEPVGRGKLDGDQSWPGGPLGGRSALPERGALKLAWRVSEPAVAALEPVGMVSEPTGSQSQL